MCRRWQHTFSSSNNISGLAGEHFSQRQTAGLRDVWAGGGQSQVARPWGAIPVEDRVAEEEHNQAPVELLALPGRMPITFGMGPQQIVQVDNAGHGNVTETRIHVLVACGDDEPRRCRCLAEMTSDCAQDSH
ncbi:unnamed protein product [Mycena citricolor]|uniref:Uncharacterized protein n=1 Tax=Mycena citricolor TaxID=2018698 RepID=A0AAD2GT02_9AGAR|nr:unnamed protein product [Mycena citricolor]